MPDGRIVLADYTNDQIIILDVNFNIQSKLKLPIWPWDVAVDGTNDVIASLPHSKQLQWIHVTTDLRSVRTVKTGISCWGIAVYKGEIYTCVGNIYDGNSGKPDGNACVQVLDRAGTVILSIGLDASGNGIFTYPRYITVSAGGRVFVSDWYQDRIYLACFTNGGYVVYDVRGNKSIRSPYGLLADEDDNLLVCCTGSNDVRVFSKDGTFTKVLLTSADVVKYPLSVSYRHSDSTLILTMNNKPPCRAYKLKYN